MSPKIKIHPIDIEILRQRRIVTLHKDSYELNFFKILRTKILNLLRKNNWHSFAITAPTPKTGKALIAANLAIAMAMDMNQSVLLVDLDLAEPKIHWYFDLIAENGLKEYILNDISIDEVLVAPEIERLLLLPNFNPTPQGHSEILSSPKMRQLIAQLKIDYPDAIIMFNLAPVLLGDDILVSMDYYDALLMIVEDSKNTPNEIKEALKVVKNKQLLGTILNKAEMLPESQGYYENA